MPFVKISIILLALASTLVTAATVGPSKADIVATNNGQCALAMVDNHLFSSSAPVYVFAISTKGSNCPATATFEKGIISDPMWITLERLSIQGWEGLSGQPFQLAGGEYNRQKVAKIEGLADGQYRLTLVNGKDTGPWYYQDALHFSVGSTIGTTEQRMPRFKSARVTHAGVLYFRGELAGGFATGYLYQVQKGGETLVVLVEFSTGVTSFTTHPSFRGGILDPPWVGVRLPASANRFDPSLPVFASVTADGGGATVQGVVFDPTDPSAFFNGFSQK